MTDENRNDDAVNDGDQNDDTEPLQPLDAPAEPGPARTRLRDRAFGLRGLAAVALAGLLLGGAGGALVGAVAAGGEGGDGSEHGRPYRGELGGPEGHRPGLPPGGPVGGVPPSTAPSQDDDSQRDSGGTTSGDDT